MTTERARSSDGAPGGPARPSGDGPRFALRFEDGRGRLHLAQAFRFAFGIVDELVLDLGRLRFPLDLSAGPARFRTRRTRVRAARVRLDLPAILEAVVEEPYALAPLAPSGDTMTWALGDAFGTVAFETRARFEGSTLRVVAGAARAANEGPAPPLARVVVAARALGFDLEVDRGALAAPRALSRALTEALVPHGWRAPDDRAARVAIEILGPRRVALFTVDEGADEPVFDPEPWERARRLAPIVAALTLGDVERATSAWAELRERVGDAPGLLEDGAALGLAGAPPDPRGSVARALALRASLRAGALEPAAEHARALALVEPCDAVAVEGLCAAADLAMDARPELAATLLELASGRRPSDPRLALRLMAALARLGRHDALEAALAIALAAREPGPDRGAFAKEAALLCELAGEAKVAARAWRAASEETPSDPRVLEGLASVHEREGGLPSAIDLFDRAASAYRADEAAEDEARALGAAARVAERAGRLEVAEDRLTRASGRAARPSETLAALARVRRALGASDAAARAEDRLLAALEGVPPGAAPGAVTEQLALAAEHALDAEGLGRARSFLGALARLSADHPRREGLESRARALELREYAGQPARLFELDVPRLAEVLRTSADAGELAREAIALAHDRSPAIDKLARVLARADGELAAALAPVVGPHAELVTDGDTMLALERLEEDGERRARLALLAADRLRAEGREGDAARALARVGAARRDMAMLRAALTAAERAGDTDAARAILDVALEVVGDGPARGALEAMRRRL